MRDTGRGYPSVCPRGSTIHCALVAVAQVNEYSSSLISFVPGIRPMKTVGTGQAFSTFSGRGFFGTLFPLLFLSVLQLLSPSIPLFTKYWAGHHHSIFESCAWNCLPKTGTQTLMTGTLAWPKPWCLVLGPSEVQVLDVCCRENSVKDKALGKK